jgi:uncharacterized protein (TIGR00369 family)
MSAGHGIPAGFRAMALGANPYIETVGPLYGRRDGERLVLAIRVQRRHCSPSGFSHGGMLLTMADMLLVVGANLQAGLHRFMSTVSLSADFLAPVPQGAWLEGRLDVLKVTRNLVFCQGMLSMGVEADANVPGGPAALGESAALGTPVVRVDGIVKPIGDADPRFSADRFFA